MKILTKVAGSECVNLLSTCIFLDGVCCMQGNLLSLYNVVVEGEGLGPAGKRFGVCIRSMQTDSLTPTGQRSFYGANVLVYVLPYTSAQPTSVRVKWFVYLVPNNTCCWSYNRTCEKTS